MRSVGGWQQHQQSDVNRCRRRAALSSSPVDGGREGKMALLQHRTELISWWWIHCCCSLVVGVWGFGCNKIKRHGVEELCLLESYISKEYSHFLPLESRPIPLHHSPYPSLVVLAVTGYHNNTQSGRQRGAPRERVALHLSSPYDYITRGSLWVLLVWLLCCCCYSLDAVASYPQTVTGSWSCWG